MNLWRNTDGHLIVGTNGSPVLCDDCPCVEGCAGFASSYTIAKTATWAATVCTLADLIDIPTCYGSPGAGHLCFWKGTVAGRTIVMELTDTGIAPLYKWEVIEFIFIPGCVINTIATKFDTVPETPPTGGLYDNVNVIVA